MTTRANSLRRARVEYITEESVYGTVLVSAVIVASGTHGPTPMQLFLNVLIAVIVFWAAHVYAGTIAGHGIDPTTRTSLSESFRHSLKRSIGFLTSAVPPSVVLLLGALEAIDDTVAIWTALWLGVVILFVLGFAVFALRGDSWPTRILGALGTAAFGIAMILLKSFIH